MRVLIIKTSSLGDVIHTLPAITDAAAAIPGIRFDWVVEESFAEVPRWHPAVDRVIPVALRRWRKDWRAAKDSGEWQAFVEQLRADEYDAVIDAQGLIKSAWLARKAHGTRHGLSWRSAREPLASLAYQRRHRISWRQHAVSRVRQLFGAALGYRPPIGLPDYGIPKLGEPAAQPYVLFFHGTTWTTKHYPVPYWCALAQQVTQAGYEVHLPWGSEPERARAQRIAEGNDAVRVLPAMNLAALAMEISAARGVVAVDTGLSHLVAAFGVPQVAIYGATDPARTGAYGKAQFHLKSDFDCAPCLRRECRYDGESAQKPACYDRLPPAEVFECLIGQIDTYRGG